MNAHRFGYDIPGRKAMLVVACHVLRTLTLGLRQ